MSRWGRAFGYDFMVGLSSRRKLQYFTIIIVAILSEIVRNILKVIVGAKFFRESYRLETWAESSEQLKYQRIKMLSDKVLTKLKMNWLNLRHLPQSYYRYFGISGVKVLLWQ
jgi:hypothetical protein